MLAAIANHLPESTCEVLATACTASRGNPLLWKAMRANLELSKDCHKAWCARLAWFLKCHGVLRCEEMDMCNPPDLDMVAQAVLLWAGSCRQQLLHAGATVQNTYVAACTFRALALLSALGTWAGATASATSPTTPATPGLPLSLASWSSAASMLLKRAGSWRAFKVSMASDAKNTSCSSDRSATAGASRGRLLGAYFLDCAGRFACVAELPRVLGGML
jgi:hypothetical protein